MSATRESKHIVLPYFYRMYLIFINLFIDLMVEFDKVYYDYRDGF